MYYVYQLSDPRCGSVFYVGKGKGDRASQHEYLVRRGRRSGNSKKDERIIAILGCGQSVGIEIVARYENQEEAFHHEISLIASTPNLTNITRGGEGWALSTAERERRAARRKALKDFEKHKATRKWLKEWLARVDKWPGVTFPGMKDGTRLAEELVAYVRDSLSKDVEVNNPEVTGELTRYVSPASAVI